MSYSSGGSTCILDIIKFTIPSLITLNRVMIDIYRPDLYKEFYYYYNYMPVQEGQ